MDLRKHEEKIKGEREKRCEENYKNFNFFYIYIFKKILVYFRRWKMCLKLRYRSNIPIWDISERLIKRFIKINKVSALSQDDPSEDHPVIISFDNDRELVHEGAAISHIDKGVSIRRSFWRECNGLAGRTARENRTAAIHTYIYIYMYIYTHIRAPFPFG